MKVVTGNPCHSIWPIHTGILTCYILSFQKSYPTDILPTTKLIFWYPVSLSYLFWNIPSPKTWRKMYVPTQNLLQRVLSVPVKKTVLTSSLWTIWLSNLDLVYEGTGQIFNLWKICLLEKNSTWHICVWDTKSYIFFKPWPWLNIPYFLMFRWL